MTEQVLDSILAQLSDDSEYVEYWTRLEWKSIEAHADVDERLARDAEDDARGSASKVPYRYPASGHVLYLAVGTNVRGPTCVFPGRRSGGDLLLSSPSTSDCRADDSSKDRVELVTVPAVQGRLLRFSGDTLHAVPRPHDLWLLPFVRGAPAHVPEEVWGRSVILFNTWNGSPPRDIPLDAGESEAHGNGKVENADDREESGQRSLPCNDRSEWTTAFDLQSSRSERTCSTNDEQTVNVKVRLLGSEKRREHTMRTVRMKAPSAIESALQQTEDVSRVYLERA